MFPEDLNCSQVGLLEVTGCEALQLTLQVGDRVWLEKVGHHGVTRNTCLLCWFLPSLSLSGRRDMSSFPLASHLTISTLEPGTRDTNMSPNKAVLL